MKSSIIDLKNLEIRIYFATWTGGIFYGAYQLYLASSYFDGYGRGYNMFDHGWSWIGRKLDVSDIEWALWIPFLYQLIPWMITHFFVSQFLKYLKSSSTIVCCWYIFISTTFLWYYIGVVGMLLMLTQPTIACVLTSFRSKKVAYIVQFATLVIVQMTSTLTMVLREWLGLNYRIYFILITSIFWTQMRSVSCSIDNIDDCKRTKNAFGFLKHFIYSTAYCLYLPTLFMGPFILYSEFIKGINEPFQTWTAKRSIMVTLNLMRFTFWIFFTEFGLHFVYCNVFQYHPNEVAKLNSWAFYGMGYCMGQYFHNKYVVIYGIFGEISRADDIDAPPPPKCVGRIHLYSDMWKNFDRGMYHFLVKYFYMPISSMDIPFRKLFASFVTFSFVFVWHGFQRNIFMWSLLNFLGLTIEGLVKSIGNSTRYIEWQEKYLSPANTRRFHCALASPLFALSVISNFYFFAGQEIGNIFMYRLFYDSAQTTGVLLFFIYCCCQVSTEVKNYEQRKVLKMKCKKHRKHI